MKRTHLPLNGLRVFDAAARHLSFTRAADELAVTPAAVGQQIRALEDTLGVVLFRRATKGLELTPEGEAGLLALRAGFLEFEEAVRAMQAGQASAALTIAAPRGITSRWLLPRLAAYRAERPELRFLLIPTDEPLDFTEANLDVALRLAEDPGGLEGVRLEPAGWVTVGEGTPIAFPGSGPVDAPVRVGDAGLALGAALAGLGQARVPALLATTAGLDVGGAEPGGSAYWLVAPTPQWRQKKVKALVAALTA
ncbi:MAG: Glycine cleavage system transcriptional activator [uncultured Sphingomonadaceae bacterium]|uniref:Glycine cleavage system transcriptional activator n=1 Tax=uncultured Sphingomonadaceae bacterium TaxID=169976 RepID=A0A6J4TB75_9SPHN|nr:MAG: Glycine cleavage system transcriptional activator [uncultured Sphingomonadaceae bacterium]